MRQLKKPLSEHYDFEALFPSVWLFLYAWYSADMQIARSFKLDETVNHDGLLGSMGQQTLKNVIQQGKLTQDQTQKLKSYMELDLYPSAVKPKHRGTVYNNYEDFTRNEQNHRLESEPSGSTLKDAPMSRRTNRA